MQKDNFILPAAGSVTLHGSKQSCVSPCHLSFDPGPAGLQAQSVLQNSLQLSTELCLFASEFPNHCFLVLKAEDLCCPSEN